METNQQTLRKNRITILFLFLLFVLQIRSQNVLFFSEEVETTFLNHIKERPLDKNSKYYVRLTHLSMDTIQINITYYDFLDKKSATTKLVESTNTKMKLRDKQIPLLYDDDFSYSLIVKSKDKEGLTNFDIIPRGGFYIVFEAYHPEKIIKTGLEQ
jgi:hypothetical protein